MKTVADAIGNREGQFIEWLTATGECALAGIGKGHRCKGLKEAVRGPHGGHVLLCSWAADELHERAGLFAASDEQLGDLLNSWTATAWARWETADLSAQLMELDRRAA